MVKMLMLDGPLAGKVWDVPGNRVYPVQAIDPSGVAEYGINGEYRLVTYFPKTFMFGARAVVVGTCGSPGRRELEELVFAALASDVAKEAAGPLPEYVCDHQAADIRCPRGCHGEAVGR